ncbi:MAG: ComEC/Rec2 family competence protein [Candidatus Omnitrophica bacterium]|nr:ComEC/Rec2 family competence protein [Candidatus Omnitrophota bacterium]
MVIFFVLGGIWYLANSHHQPESLLNKDKRFVLKVISLPKNTKLRSSFAAEIDQADGHPFRQTLRVYDYTKSLEYLNSYEVLGKLTRRSYHDRWFYYLWIKSKARINELSLNPWDKFVKGTSLYILDIFRKNSTDQAYRFLAAVFLGRRELLGGEREFFSRAGASHLLAISGLHVGLTALILFSFLGFFGLSFRLRLGISLVFLYLYTFLTGVSPSTLRAVIMYSVFAFSFFLKRRPHSFNSLGLAGLICLLIDPAMLFTIGFQLSFMAVFAILVGYRIFPVKLVGSRALVYSGQIFFCSLFVNVFVTPLTAYYFGNINTLGIVYNIVLIPFFTFILTINFFLIILAPVSFIAQNLGALLSFLILIFVYLVRFLGSFSFSYFSWQFSLTGVFGYYFVLAGILVFFKLKSSLKLQSPDS